MLVLFSIHLQLFLAAHSKATHIDPRFGPGWLGFGHAFAVEVCACLRAYIYCMHVLTYVRAHACSCGRKDFFFFDILPAVIDLKGEHDQAMAAYCSAARLMPGCHLPLLCVGIEYMQTNNLRMASQHMESARLICGRGGLAMRRSFCE